MKEIRFFYAPDIEKTTALPPEEAAHAVRVLRMQEGEEILLTDGRGTVYKAEITVATNKQCLVSVKEALPCEPLWRGFIHLAVAPTKNIDRIEWLAEKATEIGFNALTFIKCDYSERKTIKTERVEKILVSAMKQSHKGLKPLLSDLTNFASFIKQDFGGQKFIAHCYEDEELIGDGKPFLLDAQREGEDVTVMIGPEGDFSAEEVREAIKYGFRPINLGKSRLRTETAALVAVHLMNLKNRI